MNTDSPWIDLRPYWAEIQAEATRRHQMKQGYKSTNPWTKTEKSHLYGLCGEKAVSLKTGMEVDMATRTGGDPGWDFQRDGVTYDAKTATYWSSPDLKEYPNPNKPRPDIYILVALDEGRRRARIVGWATKSQVRHAHQKTYGNGLMSYLTWRELEALDQLGLPPTVFWRTA